MLQVPIITSLGDFVMTTSPSDLAQNPPYGVGGKLPIPAKDGDSFFVQLVA